MLCCKWVSLFISDSKRKAFWVYFFLAFFFNTRNKFALFYLGSIDDRANKSESIGE